MISLTLNNTTTNIVENTDIINNLVTDTSSKVLSASQGLVLNNRLTDLETNRIYAVQGTSVVSAGGTDYYLEFHNKSQVIDLFKSKYKDFPDNVNMMDIRAVYTNGDHDANPIKLSSANYKSSINKFLVTSPNLIGGGYELTFYTFISNLKKYNLCKIIRILYNLLVNITSQFYGGTTYEKSYYRW